jgi:hypothetical protein
MAMTLENETSPKSITGGPSTTNGEVEVHTEAGAAKAMPQPIPAGARPDVRFHIFVIDTGWNCAANKVLREHINMISDLHIDDELFVLDRPTSIALLRHYPLQVGRDPIIAVHDLHPRHRHRTKHTHGFRMHLGILDTEQQVLAALRMFARFLITHRNAADLDQLVRKDLHRQGLAGAIEIIGGREHQKMIE